MTSATLWNGLAVKGLIEASNGTQIGVVTTMPTASSKLKGCAVLYAGTSGTYANGALYQCTLSGSTYSWTKIDSPTAARLTSARSLKVALGSTSAASFDGSADATGIGVSGTLPVANGGTGATSLASITVGAATKATQDGSGNTITDTYMPKAGGTMTGALTVNGNVNGHYLTGTWLQTTAITNKNADTGKIAVIDGSGWVYYRTPAQIKTEMGAASAPLVVQDASVTWASDSTYSDFPYKGTITVSGCTANHIPSVTFSVAQATSGDMCPVSESATNAVYIWAKTNTETKIPVVVAMPQ